MVGQTVSSIGESLKHRSDLSETPEKKLSLPMNIK
jgi:hypothetical protein